MILDEFAQNGVEIIVVSDGANPPLKTAALELRRQQKEKQKAAMEQLQAQIEEVNAEVFAADAENDELDTALAEDEG